MGAVIFYTTPDRKCIHLLLFSSPTHSFLALPPPLSSEIKKEKEFPLWCSLLTVNMYLDRMLELGANVNHADVHNTTPLMDVVSLAGEDRALNELARLERAGRYVHSHSQSSGPVPFGTGSDSEVNRRCHIIA
jgi:hypothetical protein